MRLGRGRGRGEAGDVVGVARLGHKVWLVRGPVYGRQGRVMVIIGAGCAGRPEEASVLGRVLQDAKLFDELHRPQPEGAEGGADGVADEFAVDREGGPLRVAAPSAAGKGWAGVVFADAVEGIDFRAGIGVCLEDEGCD